MNKADILKLPDTEILSEVSAKELKDLIREVEDPLKTELDLLGKYCNYVQSHVKGHVQEFYKFALERMKSNNGGQLTHHKETE